MSVPRAPALVPTSPNPGAISIFAPPKTGSTFLSAFLAALAAAAAVCHLRTTRYRCAHSHTLSCGSRRVHHIARFLPHCCDVFNQGGPSEVLNEPMASASARGAARSCTADSAYNAAHWLSTEPQRWLWGKRGAALQLYIDYNASKNTVPATARPALGQPLSRTIMRATGFVNGPLRLADSAARRRQAILHAMHPRADFYLYTSTPTPPRPLASLEGIHLGFANVLLLHTRHPVESIVSHFYCVSSARICPRRHALAKGAQSHHLPKGAQHPAHEPLILGAATASHRQHIDAGPNRSGSLGAFVANELASPISSTTALFGRLERLADLIERAARHGHAMVDLRFTRRAEEPRNGRRVGGEPHETPHGAAVTVVAISRYETMVASFAAWLSALVQLLPSGVRGSHKDRGSRLVRILRHRFESSFVTDGRHRHVLVPGSNLAKLPRATLQWLADEPRVISMLLRLGYVAGDPWPVTTPSAWLKAVCLRRK